MCRVSKIGGSVHAGDRYREYWLANDYSRSDLWEYIQYLPKGLEKSIVIQKGSIPTDDFETEDEKYYAEVEKHLIAQTLAYIKKNQKHFR